MSRLRSFLNSFEFTKISKRSIQERSQVESVPKLIFESLNIDIIIINFKNILAYDYYTALDLRCILLKL